MVKFFFTGLLFWGIFLSPTAQNNQRITNFGIIKEKVDSNRFKCNIRLQQLITLFIYNQPLPTVTKIFGSLKTVHS